MDINHSSISNTNQNKPYAPATATQSTTRSDASPPAKTVSSSPATLPKQPDQIEGQASVPKDALDTVDATVTKALAASNLAQTERNKAIVAELLSNRMPVDKQSLQTLIRYAMANKEASPLTLVLMYKNNLPLTPMNIRQFEDYRNGTHQLLTDMQKLMRRLSDYIKSAMDLYPTHLSDAQGNPPVDASVVNKLLRINSALLDILYQDERNISLSQETSLLQALEYKEGVQTSVQEQTLSQLKEQLQNLSRQNVLQQDIKLLTDLQQNLQQQGTETLTPQQEDALQGLSQLETDLQENTLQQMAKLQNNPHEEILQQMAKLQIELREDTLLQMAKLQTDLHEDSLQRMDKKPATLKESAQQKLMQKASQQQTMLHKDIGVFAESLLLSDHPLLSGEALALADVLDPMKQQALGDNLSFLPAMEKLQEVFGKESVPVKDMLLLLRDHLMEASPEEAAKLLSSEDYHNIIEAAFLHKWTITPEKLAKKTPISNLLKELNKDLDRMGTLLKAEEQTKEGLPMNESIKKMQDNLQFIKDLNQVFPYLQLPLRLKDQLTHGDLYVMTRRKALREKKDRLSVLLHLTMKQLGPLNIFLQIDHKQIRADFYTEEAATADILGENLPSLEEMLMQRGYSLHALVKKDYKKPDFVKDFLEDDQQDNPVKHYTFDMRT